MLLDRLDELPMRNAGEIRGNPAGLLARLLERIDALKSGAEPPDEDLMRLCRRPRPDPRRHRRHRHG